MVSNIFYFHPCLEKIPILTNIFRRGWNHQLESDTNVPSKTEKFRVWKSPNLNDWSYLAHHGSCSEVTFSQTWHVTPPKINMSTQKGTVSQGKTCPPKHHLSVARCLFSGGIKKAPVIQSPLILQNSICRDIIYSSSTCFFVFFTGPIGIPTCYTYCFRELYPSYVGKPLGKTCKYVHTLIRLTITWSTYPIFSSHESYLSYLHFKRSIYPAPTQSTWRTKAR